MSRPARSIFVVSLLVWFVIAGYIVDHSLAPRGLATLRWLPPAQPTAHFSWSGNDLTATTNHLAAGQTRNFSVTLPRGFTRGQVTISSNTTNPLRLTAVTQPDQPRAVATAQSTVTLSVEWSKLIASGRTFRFTIENLNQDNDAKLTSIVTQLQR